jgi:hypothetical protein
MKKKHMIIVALLIIALIFSVIAVAGFYFPGWRILGGNSFGGGTPAGNIKIVVEKTLPLEEGK